MYLRAALIVMVATVLASVQQSTPTQAQQAGTTEFEGTQEAGGPVRVLMTADPDRITHFEIEGVAGGGPVLERAGLEVEVERLAVLVGGENAFVGGEGEWDA